jgi:hypothetical protein
MRYRYVAVALLGLTLTACYRVTVETGAPYSPTRIERPWQMSFAAGLVPPPEINTEAECPMGIAQIQTQRSFLNELAAAITSSIITPMDVRFVCASGPVQR